MASTTMPESENGLKKKRKIESNESSDSKKLKVAADEELSEEAEQSSAKKITTFCVKEFRSKLRSPDNLKYLRDFANCAEWKTTENDILLEYLDMGGTLSEIISLLDITAQGDLATALPVFRAVYLLLLRIQSDLKQYEEEAQQSIAHILSSFVTTIQSMITINSPKHRKVVLKLLTAIVTLNSSYGRQILNWFHMTPPQQEQYTEPGPVRKAYIMFLLAFFVDGKFTLFRPLLEKKGFLSAVLPNLKYDDEQTVSVFLSVLKDKMLANPKVPKTTKLNIFNTQAIQCLFELYNWIGPKGVQKGWKKPRKMAAADEEALLLVTSTLTDFLLILCTCRKNGVVFWDKSLGAKSPMNQVIYTALDVIPKPWEKSETSSLVVKILQNAPDLIKPCLSRWDSSFMPRDSILWVQSLNFIIQVYSAIESDQIATGALEVLSKTQLQLAIRGLFLSPPLLKHIESGLSSENLIWIRCHCLRLLTVMASKLTEIVNALASRTLSNDIQKKNLIYPFLALVPDVRSIGAIWQSPPSEAISVIQPAEGIDVICANFVLSVAQLSCSLFDNPHWLCKTLLQNIDEKSSDVQSAVLQAVSLLEPTFLTPESDQFESALRILLFLSSDDNTRTGSLSALFAMLFNTGLWDHRPEQLDCWLGIWLQVKPSGRELAAQVLINGIGRASKNPNYGANALVYAEVIGVYEEMKSKLTKEQKADLKLFLTQLTLQLSCFSKSTCLTLVENKKILLFDVKSCLLGDKTAVSLMPNPLEKEFVLWLIGDDDKKCEISFNDDYYQLFSLFNFSVHFLRFWLKMDQFNETRQNKFLNGVKAILEDASSKVLSFRENEISFISVNQSSRIFLMKILQTFLNDSLLIGRFDIIKKNEFTPWFKKLIIGLNFSNKRVDVNILMPWKTLLLSQLRQVLKVKKEMACSSDDIKFWLSFVRPSVEDLTTLLSNLSSSTAGNIASSANCEAFGAIWLATVKVLGQKNAPYTLMSDIVRCLCKVVLVEQCNSDTVDALLQIIKNFPLAILDISKDFMKLFLAKKEISNSLIGIASLCVQKTSHQKLFTTILCHSINTININAALAIIDNLHNCRQYVLQDDESINKPFLTDKQIIKALPALAKKSWRSLRTYICGEENLFYENYLSVTKELIKELGLDEKRVRKILKALNGNHPRIEVFTVVALSVQTFDNEITFFWLQQLCLEAMSGNEWKEQSQVIQMLAKNKCFDQNFIKLKKTKVWKSFLKFTLRNLKVTAESCHVASIRAVVETAYSQEDGDHLTDIFHKCTSHSEFMPIMLSDAPIKGEIVYLLFILTRLQPQVMVLGHIPLYLSAFHGSLSFTDQKLLEILKKYEEHCGSLSKFEPLFWGPRAISHYSVKGNTGLSLWKQVTMKSVLEILTTEKINQTITDFPIHRQLTGGDIVSTDNNVYDPAFLLPLFSNLFSPGAVSYCLSFIHTGALSLTIAALSSTDSHMRGAAAVVLSRFYSHLQLVQHFKQKPVWLHFLDCIRFGCENIDTSPISGVVTVFLARAVLEVSDPQAPLYSLHRFLIAKPVFNLRMLPEFVSLFYSNDLNYIAHRKWILEVLRDGIKVSNDVNLVLKSSAFKLCLTSFTLATTSNEIKILILQVLQKIVNLDSVPEAVILDLGLLSWLRLVCRNINEPLATSFISLFKSIIIYFYKVERQHGKIGKKMRLLSQCQSALGGYISNINKPKAIEILLSLIEKS